MLVQKTASKRVCFLVAVDKGQTVTDYWRLVNHHGGYTWLQSRATLVCNAKSLDDQHIVVINYVIGCKLQFVLVGLRHYYQRHQ